MDFSRQHRLSSTAVWTPDPSLLPAKTHTLTRPGSPMRLSRAVSEQSQLQLVELRARMQLLASTSAVVLHKSSSAAFLAPRRQQGSETISRRSNNVSLSSWDEDPSVGRSGEALVADTPALDVYDDSGIARFLKAYKFEVRMLFVISTVTGSGQ